MLIFQIYSLIFKFGCKKENKFIDNISVKFYYHY